MDCEDCGFPRCECLVDTQRKLAYALSQCPPGTRLTVLSVGDSFAVSLRAPGEKPFASSTPSLVDSVTRVFKAFWHESDRAEKH